MLKITQLGMGFMSSSTRNIQMGVVDVYYPSSQHTGKQKGLHRADTWPPPGRQSSAGTAGTIHVPLEVARCQVSGVLGMRPASLQFVTEALEKKEGSGYLFPATALTR